MNISTVIQHKINYGRTLNSISYPFFLIMYVMLNRHTASSEHFVFPTLPFLHSHLTNKYKMLRYTALTYCNIT